MRRGFPEITSLSFVTGSVQGDFDCDGDVDQEDFGHFQACYTGSGVGYEPECELANFDGDSDVDLIDFSVFQGCIGGANQPPGC